MTYARVRLHNILAFLHGYHITLGNHRAIFSYHVLFKRQVTLQAPAQPEGRRKARRNSEENAKRLGHVGLFRLSWRVAGARSLVRPGGAGHFRNLHQDQDWNCRHGVKLSHATITVRTHTHTSQSPGEVAGPLLLFLHLGKDDLMTGR